MKKTTNFLGRLLVSLLCITVVTSSCEGDNPFWVEDKEQGKSESSGDDIITNTSGGVTLTVSLRNLSMTGVAFYGEAKFAENNTANTFGILYSEQEVFTADTAEKIQIIDIYGTNYSVSTSSLKPGTTYYYTSYIQQGDLYKCGEIKSFTTKSPVAPSGYTNLSASSPSNCYIVSQCGSYCFVVVKGNDASDLLYQTKASEVLWESFGTDVEPNVGDLIKSVSYKDGYIAFQTADSFKEGNAVIAAKDASGTILWSWHIWFTDEPQGQEYYNNAGIMMDRNLGATSATPGDVGALGLLYQWGRKDPFLGSSSINDDVEARSTIVWPSVVYSHSSTGTTGTIEYATAHPTTFIGRNISNYDWYYTGSSSTDNTRWTTSSSEKSIYDPCPSGWRVPDGGSSGVWSTALGFSSSYTGTYDSTNEGINFSGKFGSASTIWYPASGEIEYYETSCGLSVVGYLGEYWSSTTDNESVYDMFFFDNGQVYFRSTSRRAYGKSVRCIKESN